MLERTFDEAKLESDSEDKNPRTADQAPALSKHKTRQYRDDILLDIAQDWVDIAEKLGPEATIELLNAYKDTVIRVVDAKVAEHNRLMQIAAAEDPVQEADGKAGSSGTEPPRTPAKTAAVLPTPPSTGNHSHTAHCLVEGREGALWAETVRANPELKARFAALTHEAIGKETGFLFPKTE